MTNKQLQATRQEAMDGMKPMDQAKWALSMRQWDKARDLCAGALDKDAGNAEALLVMGIMHEPCCLNQPDKALEYYGKLSAIENNPSAAFTGLAHQYRMHMEAKRYAEALRIGRLIERRYPNNAMGDRLGQYNRWLEEQANPKEEAAK
jgi:tetratricopeptide (TPR) repeat protein